MKSDPAAHIIPGKFFISTQAWSALNLATERNQWLDEGFAFLVLGIEFSDGALRIEMLTEHGHFMLPLPPNEHALATIVAAT